MRAEEVAKPRTSRRLQPAHVRQATFEAERAVPKYGLPVVPVGSAAPGVLVKRSGIKGAGNGLWAKSRFARGDPITWYSGEVISKVEARARLAAGTRTGSHYCTVANGADVVIDGLTAPVVGMGGAPFVNDNSSHAGGTRGATPNAVFVVDGLVRFLRALKTIPGTPAKPVEVFIRYGKMDWVRRRRQAAADAAR